MLNKLRKIIIKSVPSILELKFGCDVSFNDGYKYICVGKSDDYFEYWKDKGDGQRSNFTVSERNFGKPKEILGRPITLEDVLLAIGVGWAKDRQTGKIELDMRIVKLLTLWTPTNPLSQQSPEVWKFLLDILE